MSNAIGDVWELAIEWRGGAETGMIVFHKQVTEVTDIDETKLGQLMTQAIGTLAETATAASLGLDVFVNCVTARRIPPADPTRMFANFSANTPSILAEALPAQNAALLSMYPAPGAEIKSGRNFIPFLTSAAETAGQIITAAGNTLTVDFEKILRDELDVAITAKLKAVLYRAATDVLPAVVVDIIEQVLQPVIASQRRRVQSHQPFTT